MKSDLYSVSPSLPPPDDGAPLYSGLHPQLTPWYVRLWRALTFWQYRHKFSEDNFELVPIAFIDIEKGEFIGLDPDLVNKALAPISVKEEWEPNTERVEVKETWGRSGKYKIYLNGLRACPDCMALIDPETCGCGSGPDGHSAYTDGHPFVPMGCNCLRDTGVHDYAL